jgi:hypothetical protein
MGRVIRSLMTSISSCSSPSAAPRSAVGFVCQIAREEEQAQWLRWAAFEERLSSIQLRAYLKKLPDFEDVQAEERAMRHALGFSLVQLHGGHVVRVPCPLDEVLGWFT